MFGAVDNIILQRLRQSSEERAIAGYSHYECLVLLRVSLRVKESLLGYNVELYVHTLLIKVGSDESNKLGKSLHALKRRGVKLLVKESSVGCNTLLELGNRVCGSGRALHVSAGCRTNAVSQGRVS